jgi:hypothetical protein
MKRENAGHDGKTIGPAFDRTILRFDSSPGLVADFFRFSNGLGFATMPVFSHYTDVLKLCPSGSSVAAKCNDARYTNVVKQTKDVIARLSSVMEVDKEGVYTFKLQSDAKAEAKLWINGVRFRWD